MNFVNKNLVKNLFSLIFIIYLLVVPVLSFAQVTGGAPSDVEGVTGGAPSDIQGVTGGAPSDKSNTEKLKNPINVSDINSFIKTLLQGVLKLGMPIVALAIIYSGFLFVQARGRPDEITKAKDALTYTVIGAAILLGSWAIAQLIANTVLTL